MAEVRSIVPYWLWPGDGRPRRQVEDEIAEELRLHVDLLAEENVRRGMTPDDARREAEQRFGDVAAIERRCRHIKRGEIIMLQRVQAVLTTLLLIAVTFVAVRQWNSAGTTVQFMDQTTAMLHTIRRDMEHLSKQSQPSVKAADAEERIAAQRLAETKRNNLQQQLDRYKDFLEQRRATYEAVESTAAKQRESRKALVGSAKVKLAEVKGKLGQARVELEAARLNYTRVKALAESKDGPLESPATLEVATSKVHAAEAALDSLEEQYGLQRQQLESAQRSFEASEAEYDAKLEKQSAAMKRAELDVLKAEQQVAEAEAESARLGESRLGVPSTALAVANRRSIMGKPLVVREGITGVVFGGGEPLAGAEVAGLFISPDGDQELISLTTGEDGKFRFDESITARYEPSVRLTIYKDGYSFATLHMLEDVPTSRYSDRLRFVLPPATPLRLSVLHEDSADPRERLTFSLASFTQVFDERSLGRTCSVPSQVRTQHRVTSDGNGCVTLPWLSAQRRATVIVYGPLGSKMIEVEVSSEGKASFLKPEQAIEPPYRLAIRRET